MALRDAGVRRYLLQSSAFWYAPGDGLADESAPFAFDAPPAVAASTRRYAELETAKEKARRELDFQPRPLGVAASFRGTA